MNIEFKDKIRCNFIDPPWEKFMFMQQDSSESSSANGKIRTKILKKLKYTKYYVKSCLCV